MRGRFKTVFNSTIPGFSLTELLVVLVIIGILVLLALPDQSSVISKAKATEAKLQLEHLHSLEKTYFYEYSKFTNSLEDLGFEQQKVVKDGGNANYQIEVIEATPSTFRARARAVVDFDQDGTLNEWEIDHEKQLKETVKD
jgi:type IV pilus assembly protein PilE